MLLAIALLASGAAEAANTPNADTVICVNHQVRPTVFTPLRECMKPRHWVRVLRSRERNNLPIANAAQARASLPLSAQYHNLTNGPDPLAQWRGYVLDWRNRLSLNDRIDTAPSFVLPQIEGVPIRR